jgi:16S rRNA (guanine966-N2)-methyltransferase
MRVIAGSVRGRRISAPAGHDVRPTSDRVRESIFNRLESYDLIRGCTVVDLFAGSGALGIEALSRGALEATFVDENASSVRVVKANLESLGLSAVVHRMTAERFLESTAVSYDLALLDPPYEYQGWEGLLSALRCSVAVIESSSPVQLPDGWVDLKSQWYGRTHVAVVERDEQAVL